MKCCVHMRPCNPNIWTWYLNKTTWTTAPQAQGKNVDVQSLNSKLHVGMFVPKGSRSDWKFLVTLSSLQFLETEHCHPNYPLNSSPLIFVSKPSTPHAWAIYNSWKLLPLNPKFRSAQAPSFWGVCFALLATYPTPESKLEVFEARKRMIPSSSLSQFLVPPSVAAPPFDFAWPSGITLLN